MCHYLFCNWRNLFRACSTPNKETYYFLSFTTASCVSQTPSYPPSVLVQVTWSHSHFLCKPSFPSAGWSNCSVLDCPLWNYIFLEVSCPKPGTFSCETCLVVNKSKYFPYFSDPSFISATPDCVFPLLNNFISSMELLLGIYCSPQILLYTTVSYQKFPRLNFWGSLFLPNSNTLHFYFSYHMWPSLAFYHW